MVSQNMTWLAQPGNPQENEMEREGWGGLGIKNLDLKKNQLPSNFVH